MFLIMSAAYVTEELRAEFGRIPPAFLPLGNRRLFQHQIKLIPKGKTVYLSVPESFQIPANDRNWLISQNITIVPTPDGLSLGASILAVLNLIGGQFEHQSLQILYGDTLFTELPEGENLLAVSNSGNGYDWGYISDDGRQSASEASNYKSHEIICGYFHFSDIRELQRDIVSHNWDFLEAINQYRKSQPLTLCEVETWLDFGHVNTYYRSKIKHTTERAFNELTITPHWIEKSSVKTQKIKAESNWFSSLPEMLRIFTPQYLGHKEENGKFSYRLEYLHHTALNELFVFGELSTVTWELILTSALEFIDNCLTYVAPASASYSTLDELFQGKTDLRLKEYCDGKEFDEHTKWHYQGQSYSLAEIHEASLACLPPSANNITVIHGDFCFSNILYDFRTSKVKTIDPRGLTITNELTIYGDIRYDIAKLSHSILGLYDLVIAGYYQVEISDQKIDFKIPASDKYQKIQAIFLELVRSKYDLQASHLYAMQIQLFISMLPLHADDKQRQNALMANVFRLHQVLQGIEK